MHRKILFLILILTFSHLNCGVKGPPLPPISPEQQVIEDQNKQDQEQRRQREKKYEKELEKELED